MNGKFLIKGNTFANKDKPLYLANKKEITYDDYNNEIVEYDKPKYFGKVNYQLLNGTDLQAYISAYGETKNKLARAFVDVKHKDKFKEFDLAYLYGATPDGELQYGDKANYIVRSVKEQNVAVMIIFEEIIKEISNEIS